MAERVTLGSVLAAGLATGAASARSRKGFGVSMAGFLGRTVTTEDGSFWESILGRHSLAGKRVTVDTTLTLSAVWACVRLISETAATLPFNVFRSLPDGSREVAQSMQLHELLKHRPAAEMTAVEFWQVVLASLLLWGNAFVQIRRRGGVITSLEFLLPQHITWRRLSSGALEWTYADPTTKMRRTIGERDMWHVRGFGLGSVLGLSPIQYGVQVFGNAMAAENACAETFRNALKSPGLVMMDAVLKPEQRTDIRNHVRTVSQEGGVMVLEKGAGYQQLTMNPQDAELLASRGYGVEEVCRWFGVPPSMVGHAEKSTSWGTGIEQQMLGFITFVLRPWLVRLEQAVREGLMTPAERVLHTGEFALEGLLRGDSASRAAFYSVMSQNGAMTRDEIRVKENLPRKGGQADVLTVQSNLVPIDQLGQGATGATAAADAIKAWLGLADATTTQDTKGTTR